MAPCCSKIGNSVELPQGTKYKIVYSSKSNAIVKTAVMCPGPDKNVFYALFDEDDVDFRLVIDNQDCKDRECRTDVSVRGEKSQGFVNRRGTCSSLEALESNGRRLHFVSGSSLDGQAIVAAAAKKLGSTYDDAANLMCRMELSARYSPVYTDRDLALYIKTLTGKTIELKGLQLYTSIESIKLKIQDKEGIIANQQRLIFEGKQLRDDYNLKDYNIIDKSILHVILRLRGGGEPPKPVQVNEDVERSFAELQITKDSSAPKERSVKSAPVSKRGVICFGEKSNQAFKECTFQKDDKIQSQTFIIELRMVSKYN